MWVRTSLLATLLAALILSAPQVAGAGSGRYVDDDHSRYEGHIEAGSEASLVSGCNPPDNDRFCPHRAVTRGEMALMLARAIALPAADGDHFSDDDGRLAEPAINSLAAVGATTGCERDAYCPDRALTRGEMASLITRTLNWRLHRINPYRFNDIDDTHHGRALFTLANRNALEPCDPPEGRRLCGDAVVTRDEAVFALVEALELTPRLPGGRSGPEVGFHDDFEELALWDGQKPGSRNRVKVTENGFRGSGLDVTIPRGSHFGADFRLDLDDVVGEDPETLFFRYYLKFDKNWNPRASGKLPGFSGIYHGSGKGGFRSTPSSPGWSARMKFSGNRPGDPRALLGFYVYHLGQERRYGDGMNWNDAGRLRPDEWYCVEGQVQMNTPGVANGALRGWVDGTLAFEEAGIQFRRPSEPEIKVESFWFNVYYGGKPTAPSSMGLTVDEVAVDGSRIGCGGGGSGPRSVQGDLTGDGHGLDQMWWGDCTGTPCFRTRLTSRRGQGTATPAGNGAWFSTDSDRLGLVAADIDGDGDDDVLYRGRCRASKPCWRAHKVEDGRAGPGLDWGDGARFSAATRSLVVGDFDGDGRDDLTYVALCGSKPAAQPCWRTHLTGEGGFVGPADWGGPPSGFDSTPQAEDLDGDGRDDLLFAGACGDHSCWFMQAAREGRFAKPVKLGRAREVELANPRVFDFTGNGRADIVAIRSGEKGAAVEIRPLSEKGLGKARVILESPDRIDDLSLRRRPTGPVEALVVRQCDQQQRCVEPLVTLSGLLVSEEQYRRAMLFRQARYLATQPGPFEIRVQ